MSQIIECRRCETPIPDGSLFCNQCGEEIEGDDSADTHARLRDRLSRALGDRYRVGDVLGAGGMGVVFLADDVKHSRKVAIKVLLPELASDAKVVERFGREARTAAGLDHPGVVQIYETGSERGLHYFVMQYATGRPLDEVLREKSPVSIAFARRVLCEAAAALAHAHRRGVVHRDVKPENIIVDAKGRVLLADFGISKVVSAKGDATTVRKLTQTGGIIGTPHYMAPEHALGQKVDGRADQYALAVVGFHMLAGRVPFDDETLPAIIHLHINAAAPRLSELRPRVPAHLAAAIARAMSKAPMHRFETMDEFAAAVAGPSKTRSRARRVSWVVAPLLVAALVGGAVWARRSNGSVAHPRTESAPRLPAAATTAAKRPTVRFDVTSSPSATVRVDGKRIGVTPILEGRLSTGAHQIRLERKGYRPTIDTINVTGTESIRRRYVLRRQTR